MGINCGSFPDEEPFSDEDTDEREDDSSSWDDMIQVVGSLTRIEAESPGLARVHHEAENLIRWIHAYQERSASLVALTLSARRLASRIDEAELSPGARREIGERLDLLAQRLGIGLGAAAEADRRTTPLWLDVASPGHSRINVAGTLERCPAESLYLDKPKAFIKANKCEMANEDHYHVRRVSLDCESLYADGQAIGAFITALLNPCGETYARLHSRLLTIAGPQRRSGDQTIRARLHPRVDTFVNRPDVVFLGDGSEVRSTTHYHIRETSVPLVALLLSSHPELLESLVMQYHYGDPATAVLDALAEVDDDQVLQHARGSSGGPTTLARSGDRLQVGLAAAVMIGYGNRLTTTTAVRTGRTTKGNLDRFDRIVRRRVTAALKPYREEPTVPEEVARVPRVRRTRLVVRPPEPPKPAKSPVIPRTWTAPPQNSPIDGPGIDGISP